MRKTRAVERLESRLGACEGRYRSDERNENCDGGEEHGFQDHHDKDGFVFESIILFRDNHIEVIEVITQRAAVQRDRVAGNLIESGPKGVSKCKCIWVNLHAAVTASQCCYNRQAHLNHIRMELLVV